MLRWVIPSLKGLRCRTWQQAMSSLSSMLSWPALEGNHNHFHHVSLKNTKKEPIRISPCIHLGSNWTCRQSLLTFHEDCAHPVWCHSWKPLCRIGEGLEKVVRSPLALLPWAFSWAVSPTPKGPMSCCAVCLPASQRSLEAHVHPGWRMESSLDSEEAGKN